MYRCVGRRERTRRIAGAHCIFIVFLDFCVHDTGQSGLDARAKGKRRLDKDVTKKMSVREKDGKGMWGSGGEKLLMLEEV